jgi:glycerol-3-phosphate acyltransferase PlsY
MIDNFKILIGELAGQIGIMPVFYVIASYFVGTFSPSIILGRLNGIDIRTKGSGSAGTTNVLRTLGKRAAAVTLVIDVLKGFAAVFVTGLLVGDALAILCGIAVMCGHIWPIFHGFRGGKGVAAGLGVVLAFDVKIGVLALLVALVLMGISRRVSVGSLSAAAVFPVLVGIMAPVYLSPSLLIALIIWIKHRQNITRLLRGEEPKLNFKRKEE